MTPQTGDIWRYHNPNRPYWDDSVVLLHKLLRDAPGHFTRQHEIIFWAYDFLSDSYDEFIFTASNMEHWEKLA